MLRFVFRRFARFSSETEEGLERVSSLTEQNLLERAVTVTHLPYHRTTEQIKSGLSDLFGVKDSNISLTLTTAGFASHARIDLDSKHALLDALDLHKAKIFDRRIMVQPYAQFKANNDPTGPYDDRKVVVYGIDDYWTSKELGELFAGS